MNTEIVKGNLVYDNMSGLTFRVLSVIPEQDTFLGRTPAMLFCTVEGEKRYFQRRLDEVAKIL